MLPEIQAITTTAFKNAKATEQFNRVQLLASLAGFTLNTTPRSAKDPMTLTIPRDHPLPDPLFEQLVQLAKHLRGRALDGHCTPITIHVHPKHQHAPN